MTPDQIEATVSRVINDFARHAASGALKDPRPIFMTREAWEAYLSAGYEYPCPVGWKEVPNARDL